MRKAPGGIWKRFPLIPAAKMTGAAKAQADDVLYVSATPVLHQRPGIPGIRRGYGHFLKYFRLSTTMERQSS